MLEAADLSAVVSDGELVAKSSQELRLFLLSFASRESLVVICTAVQWPPGKAPAATQGHKLRPDNTSSNTANSFGKPQGPRAAGEARARALIGHLLGIQAKSLKGADRNLTFK